MLKFCAMTLPAMRKIKKKPKKKPSQSNLGKTETAANTVACAVEQRSIIIKLIVKKTKPARIHRRLHNLMIVHLLQKMCINGEER